MTCTFTLARHFSRSLAPPQVLWSDEVATTPVSSTRQFINTFLVDKDGEAEDAVLSRLPYDRVDINASAPVTFASNDVVRITLPVTSKTIVCSDSSVVVVISSVTSWSIDALAWLPPVPPISPSGVS